MNHRPLESSFQRKVVKALKKLANTWHYKSSDRVRSGIPDIIACVDGEFVALELKRDLKSKATPLQMHTLEQIKKAKGTALVVSPENWEETWELLINMAGALK